MLYNKYMDDRSKKYLWLLISLLILILVLAVSVYVVRQRTNLFSSAREVNYTQVSAPSLANSYLFVSPLSAAPDGEKIRISVFILDGRGLGIAGKPVLLGQNENLKVEAIQPTTDYLGKAIFDISSQKPGVYYIEAAVEGRVLPQRVSVAFK